jgi:hypothetical protein
VKHPDMHSGDAAKRTLGRTTHVDVYRRILRPMTVRTQEGDEPQAMEPPMKRGSAATMAVPLLISIGLLLSACVGSVDYGTPVYSFGMPYGSLDLAGWR